MLLKGDVLWRPEYNQPETGFRDFFEVWLSENGPAQGVDLLETSDKDLEQTGAAAADWIRRRRAEAGLNA